MCTERYKVDLLSCLHELMFASVTDIEMDTQALIQTRSKLIQGKKSLNQWVGFQKIGVQGGKVSKKKSAFIMRQLKK